MRAAPEARGFGGLRAEVRIPHFLDAEERVVLSLVGRSPADATALVKGALPRLAAAGVEVVGAAGADAGVEQGVTTPGVAEWTEERHDDFEADEAEGDRWGDSSDDDDGGGDAGGHRKGEGGRIPRRRPRPSSSSLSSASAVVLSGKRRRRRRRRLIPASGFYSKPQGALLARLRAWLQRACHPSSGGDGEQGAGTGSGGGGSYIQSFPKQEQAYRYHDIVAGWTAEADNGDDGGFRLKLVGGGGEEEEEGMGMEIGPEATTTTTTGSSPAATEASPRTKREEEEEERALRPFTTSLRLWCYQDPSSRGGRRWVLCLCICVYVSIAWTQRSPKPKTKTTHASPTNIATNTTNNRWFTVCRVLPDFAQRYLAMDPPRRHVYEMIRYVFMWPTSLYMDIWSTCMQVSRGSIHTTQILTQQGGLPLPALPGCGVRQAGQPRPGRGGADGGGAGRGGTGAAGGT